MSVKAEEFIKDAAQVVDYYGYWATFHDAKIITLSISPEDEAIAAVLEYDDTTDDESRSGSSRITLLWQDVLSYTLQADYTHYRIDSIHEINFTQQVDWIETEIVPVDGMHGTIRSKGIVVTQFDILP